MKYPDKQLVTFCWQELGNAEGSSWDSSNLVQNRTEAIDYYLGRLPKGPDVAGRSMVISPDVRNAIHNLLAEMVNLWSGEYPADFLPEGPDDVQQAEAETYAVRSVMDKCDLDLTLNTAAHDSCLLKNGIVKAWVQDEETNETRTLEGASAEEIAAFVAQAGPDAVVATKGDDATVTIPFRSRQVCIQSVDPTNFFVSHAVRSHDLEDARFVAERKFLTRSELVDMGYSKSKVKDLQAFSWDTKEDSFSRRLDYTTADEEASTRDQDTIELYECYLNISMDGTLDDADRWRIVISDETLLEKERVGYVPYASGVIIPFPHRWHGLSIFDVAKESQDIGTAGWRQWLDNNATAIQNRVVVGKGVNVEDLEAAGPNRHIRVTRGDDVRQQAMALPYADVGSSIQAMLGYKDKLRGEAIGASIDLHGDEQQLLSSQVGSLGADRIMSSQEAMSAFFLRNFSTTLIKNLFLLIHRVLRIDYAQPVMVRAGDQWGQVDPRTWRPRSQVAVRSGMSTGERNRKVGSLSTHMQIQTQAMQAGMLITDQQRLYRLAIDLGEAQELEGVRDYYLDPSSEEAQQAAQQQQQQQQQQMQMQMQMETLGDQVKMAIAKLQDETDRMKIAADLEMKEAEIVGKGTTDLSIARIQAETSAAQGNSGADGGDNQRQAGNKG